MRLEWNSGPAAARNAGARLAAGDILLFVDQDVLMGPGTIDRVVRTLDERPELAACSVPMMQPPGPPG